MANRKVSAKLERCVKQVKKQGQPKTSSFAICNASLKAKSSKKKK